MRFYKLGTYHHHKKGVFWGTAFIVLAISVSAYAHAAVLWAYVEDKHVYVEAFFMGGAKVQNSRIVVLGPDDKKLLEGKTDKEGKFDFAPPIIDDMTILLLLDQAHGSEFKIKKQDLDASQDDISKPEVPPPPGPERDD